METRTQAPRDFFRKPANHFETVEEGKDNFVKIKKKSKPDASEVRNNGIWYKIKTRSIKEECRRDVNQVNVATGELLRVLDVNQTKYRIWQEEKAEFVISRAVQGCETYKERSERERVYFFQGMGLGLTSKDYVLDCDVSPDNALVDEYGYFYVIDNDRSFAPITLPMHINQPAECPLDQSQADYDTLPISFGSNGAQKLQWQMSYDAEKSMEIATYLSTLPEFLNEKHFQTFKAIVTGHLQSAVLQHHENKSEAMRQVINLNATQRLRFTQFAKGSDACKKYIRSHRLIAICVILFEVKRFFKLNKHYVEAFGKSLQMLFAEESVFILKDCDLLLSELGEPVLSEKELAECNHFITNIDANESYQFVKHFYFKQGWRIQALFLDQDRLEIDFKAFFSHELSVIDFVSELLKKYEPCAVDPLQYFLKYAHKHHQERLPKLMDVLTDKVRSAEFIHSLHPAQQKLLGEYLFLVNQNERARDYLKVASMELVLPLLLNEEKPDLVIIKKLCEDKECQASLAALDIASFINKGDVLAHFIYTPELFEHFTDKQMAYFFRHIDFQDIDLGISVFLRGCRELKRSESIQRITNLLTRADNADDIINAMNRLVAAEKAQPYFQSQFQFFKPGAFLFDGLCEIISFAKSIIEVMVISDPDLTEKLKVKEFLRIGMVEDDSELRIDSRVSSPVLYLTPI